MGYSQVNVPQGRDKKMSVDGAKPKVFEDLINRLLSRAEHSNLWVKMWSLDRSWAAAPVLQEPLNDQSHFPWRASTSRWTIPRAFIRKRLSPWNRNVHLVIRKHFMKRNDVSWLTFVILTHRHMKEKKCCWRWVTKVIETVSFPQDQSLGPHHQQSTFTDRPVFSSRKTSVRCWLVWAQSIDSCGSTAGESGTTLSLINTDHLFLILGGQDVFMRKVPVPRR